MDYYADFMDFSAGDFRRRRRRPKSLKKILQSGVEMLHACNYIENAGTGGGAGEAPPMDALPHGAAARIFFCPRRCMRAIKDEGKGRR
jgi:hypothetical protein